MGAFFVGDIEKNVGAGLPAMAAFRCQMYG